MTITSASSEPLEVISRDAPAAEVTRAPKGSLRVLGVEQGPSPSHRTGEVWGAPERPRCAVELVEQGARGDARDDLRAFWGPRGGVAKVWQRDWRHRENPGNS